MSLRKMLGYGLVDLGIDENENIVDPRINTGSKLLDWDRESEATVREYVRSTLTDDEALDRVLNGFKYNHLNPDSCLPFDCVQHLSETDISGTLVLRAVEFGDWYRHNDLMDATEEIVRTGKQEDRVTMLRSGIYPFGNIYVDLETFERVKWDHIGDWVRAFNTPDSDADVLERRAYEAARSLGLPDLDHAALRARIAPCPPDDILNLATFGELFTKPEYVYQLRPMLVTWWQ